jgi:hypothetical protein
LLAAWALLAAAPISAAPAGLTSGAPSVPGNSTRAAEEPATETATDASADSGARACGGGGNRSYYFSGLLEVRHDGNTEPLEGVQLRIVRKGSPLKWAQGPDAVTDENGKFQVECTFARDRNGVAPWGKKIRFKVMARFRDGNFKVRKGGWAKNNWFEVAQREGCKKNGCKKFSFTLNGDERAASKTFDTGTLAGKHAYLWRFYNTLQDEMKQEGVGLTDRPGFRRKLTITYPDRNIRRWWSENIQNESSNSWFLFNVHLAEGDWNRQETMIHEWMHRWDVEHTRGSASLVCLFDKHHKAPNNTSAAAKCSGFMEGFAEATAQALDQAHFGAGSPDAFTHEQMREGDAESYEVNTLSEAQRTDIGWQNFLTALWTSNKGAFVSDASSPSGSCFTPKTLGVYDVLQAIKRERPRKAKWLVSGNSTFEWFTGVLEKQVSDFGAKDARFYQLLGDPSITGSDLQAEMCGEGMETSKEPLADAGAASGDFGGVWDTNFGELRLHQIGDYVIGDYADNGVMVGKASGTCVAGVFTNGERNGLFRFDASGGSGQFEGQWAWHGDDLGGTWNGTRTADSATQLQNFTRDGSATQVIDNERTVYDGTYDSPHGEIELLARDLFLVGDYAGKGVIAGMWDGNSYVGRFTNGDRTGWFDFAFFSKNGSFRSGQWGWIGSSGGGDWSLSERSPQTPTPDNMLDDVSCE